MRMDDRGSKRARQQREGDGIAGAEDGFGIGFQRTPVAGCHLDVKPSQTHLFPGMAIELKVTLLDDEDVVQHTTQGIDISITGEDGRVVATQPNNFKITPQRPALLGGSTTFHLLLYDGCVRSGNRIKVRVETSSGRGREQIKADSEPIMVCRSALSVVTQPPENWYKDEGGKNNCIVIEVMVREKPPPGQAGQAQPGVPLTLALVYEAGTEVHSQEILQLQADTQLVTNESGRANLKFKITEVSQRHQSQRFCVKICPDLKQAPEFSNVAPVVTVPIMVLSKRKNRRLKAEKQAAELVQSSGGMGNMASLVWATAANGHLPPPNMDMASRLPQWPPPPSILHGCRGGSMGSPLSSQQQPQQRTPHGPAAAAHAAPTSAPGVNALPPPPGGPGPSKAPVSAPVEEDTLRVPTGSTGALLKVFRWTDAVLQLLQMELQWEHIGYERDERDGSVSYTRPLFRCPVCRVCKGPGQPHQKHAADCKLSGLLAEFSGRRSADFSALVREQQQRLRGGEGASPPLPPSVEERNKPALARVKPGFRCFNVDEKSARELDRGPVSAILGFRNASDGLSGDGARDSANVVSAASLRVQSGNLLSGVPSTELLPPDSSGGMSRGLSIGFGMYDNNMEPTSAPGDGAGASRGGDKAGLARTGSVAPFVPKGNLTPAEEEAHFIMLPDGVGGDGSGSSKQLTVFSEERLLLGFYEEKYDVGQQTHLPFHGCENNFSLSAKRLLEAKLQTALDDEGTKAGGRTNAMDTDNGDDVIDDTGGQSRKRGWGAGGRPTRSSSSAAATPGVKRESAGAKKEPGGSRKVYQLRDYKDYQEMKEQVFYDWSLGPQMDMNVFDSEKTEGKAPSRMSPR